MRVSDGCYVKPTWLQACADKIAREMQDFGNPPVFPAHEEVEVVEEKSEVEVYILICQKHYFLHNYTPDVSR